MHLLRNLPMLTRTTLKLHIYGYYNGSVTDGEFYLADFTHTDSTLDYIVTDWQYVELLPGPYDSVRFGYLQVM